MNSPRLPLSLLSVALLVFLASCATVPPSPISSETLAAQGMVATDRAALVRYAPSFAAPVVQTVQAKTPLHWLDNQKQNGFYHVAIDKGHSGWILASEVHVTAERVLEGFEAFAACATTLDQCLDRGCAAEGSPDALSNTLKHHVPDDPSAIFLTFDDLAGLQQDADQAVGTGVHIPVADRSALTHLTVSSGIVSEGDTVRVIGYLVGEGTGPHPNLSGESVNCGIKGAASNDFHIPVAFDPASTEFEGFVVEMIPQNRPASWTIAKLKSIQSGHQQVWIEGNLFYDGVHRVNADPQNPLGGQPKRFSLWEVHPVTKFLVCERATCAADSEQEWSAL